MLEFFRKRSVANKLFFGVIPALIFLAFFISYSILFLNALGPALDSSSAALRESSAFSYVKTIASATSAIVGTYALSGKSELENRYEDLSRRRAESLIAAEAVVRDADAKVVLRQFSDTVNDLKKVELQIVATTKAGNKEEAATLLEEKYVTAQTDALTLLDSFIEHEREKVDGLNAGLLAQSRRIVNLGVFLLVPLMVVVVLFLYAILLRFVLRPIKNLVETTERIKNNEITARAKVFYPDDIGALASGFNAMADSVLLSEKALRDQLTERNNQVETINRLLKEQEDHVRLLKTHETELGKANEQLRKLDEFKSEFLTVAAHRLRTPLTSIRWTYEEILNQSPGTLSDGQRTILQDGYQSSVLAVKLINQLLELARLDEGRSSYTMERQSIVPIAISAVEQFKKAATYKKIIFTAHLPRQPLPDLILDHEKITIVLENILDNAIKYTPPKGSIDFSLSFEEDKAVIRVKDTGIGVPRDQKKSLFTKFFRANNALLVHTEGTGLGLYVTKRIIEGHGGTIRIESVEKQGTEITIELPSSDTL